VAGERRALDRGDLDPLSAAAIVDVYAVGALAGDAPELDAILVEQRLEHSARLPADRGAQHDARPKSSRHARNPEALAAGVEVDLGSARGELFDGDGDDRRRREDG
jgi:hypothetical protein